MPSWHGRRPPEEDHIVVAAWRERDETKAEVKRLREALTLIRDTDPVDAALDPDRARRIAAEAL